LQVKVNHYTQDNMTEAISHVVIYKSGKEKKKKKKKEEEEEEARFDYLKVPRET